MQQPTWMWKKTWLQRIWCLTGARLWKQSTSCLICDTWHLQSIGKQSSSCFVCDTQHEQSIRKRSLSGLGKDFSQGPDENELHISLPRQWHGKKKREPGKHVQNFVPHSWDMQNQDCCSLSFLRVVIPRLVEDCTQQDSRYGSHYPACHWTLLDCSLSFLRVVIPRLERPENALLPHDLDLLRDSTCQRCQM